ncbi:MAG: hypothetical protein JKX84_02925, partial [Flavobacteriales bacterium]|nr:hypothetical protein [Flavobacteriales bacterium]
MTRIITILLFVGLLAQSAFAGGPWPRKKGSGYAQLGFTYLGYSKFFNKEGGITELPRRVTDFTTQLYIDYGITDRLSFTGVLPFRYVATSNKVFASDPVYFSDTLVFRDTISANGLFGLNTVLMGLKYNIINKKVVFSVGLNGEANVAKYDSLTTLRTGPLTFVINPYVSVGSSFGKFYTLLDAGYRLRTNNYTDQINFNFEIGYSWNKKTYLIAAANGLIPLGNGGYDNNVTSGNPKGRDLLTSLSPNNQQYVGYGLKFI